MEFQVQYFVQIPFSIVNYRSNIVNHVVEQAYYLLMLNSMLCLCLVALIIH
jgi:hypothetical protein